MARKHVVSLADALKSAKPVADRSREVYADRNVLIRQGQCNIEELLQCPDVAIDGKHVRYTDFRTERHDTTA